jgi:hypothetical protein
VADKIVTGPVQVFVVGFDECRHGHRQLHKDAAAMPTA